MASPLHKWLFSPPLKPANYSLPSHVKPLSDASSVFSSSLVNVESQRSRSHTARMTGRGHSSMLASMKPIDIEAANASGEYPEKRSPVLLSPLFSPMLKAKVAHYVPRPVQRLLAVLAAFLLFATISKYTTSLVAVSAHRPAVSRDYVPPQAVRAPGKSTAVPSQCAQQADVQMRALLRKYVPHRASPRGLGRNGRRSKDPVSELNWSLLAVAARDLSPRSRWARGGGMWCFRPFPDILAIPPRPVFNRNPSGFQSRTPRVPEPYCRHACFA